MRLPPLNALRAFEVTAGTGSISAAASKLGVTPGAVSRQVANLEDHLGVALLVREGRGVRLTEDGRRLGASLSEAFALVGAAVDDLRHKVHGRRLRVLVPPIFASTWLLPRIERFSLSSDGAEVVLIDNPHYVDASSDTDVVVAWGRFEDSAATVAERLTEAEEIFPLSTRGACPESCLDGVSLIDREVVGRGWTWPDWAEFLEAVGLELNGARILGLAPGLVVDAVRRGKGVMLANSTIAHDELASGRLVRPIAGSMATSDSYWLLTPRSERERPEVASFLDWIKDEMAACIVHGGQRT